MRNALRLATCALVALPAACAELPSQPAGPDEAIQPQFDLVNMPDGQVPFYRDVGNIVDIVDESGHTIWQDVTLPTNGASFTVEWIDAAGNVIPCGVGEFGRLICRPLGDRLVLNFPPIRPAETTSKAPGTSTRSPWSTLSRSASSGTCRRPHPASSPASSGA